MHLDCRDYPIGYHFAAVVSKELGIYVRVANFTMQQDRRMFRMIVDAEVDRRQLRELLFSTVKDAHGSYEFSYMEAMTGPIVDDTTHRSTEQHYMRITFMQVD